MPESLAAARYAAIIRLRDALVRYQTEHQGKLPANIADSGFDSAFWLIPVSGGLSYRYQPDDKNYIVVMPQINDSPVLCLDTFLGLVERSKPVPLADKTDDKTDSKVGEKSADKSVPPKGESK